MKELLFVMATTIPRKKIIEELKEALQEFDLVPTEDNQKRLEMHMHMFSINLMCGEGNIEKAIEMAKDMDTFEKRTKLFETEQN